jgi:hypothetical protein
MFKRLALLHHAEQMDISNIQVIDLPTPVNEIASAIVTTNNFAELSLATTSSAREQISYKSRTLALSSGRHLILSAFPASIDKEDDQNLLLANVPVK